MKPNQLRKLALILCAPAASLVAADPKPSEASVKELLLLSDSPKMLDMSKGQLATKQRTSEPSKGRQVLTFDKRTSDATTCR